MLTSCLVGQDLTVRSRALCLHASDAVYCLLCIAWEDIALLGRIRHDEAGWQPPPFVPLHSQKIGTEIKALFRTKFPTGVVMSEFSMSEQLIAFGPP